MRELIKKVPIPTAGVALGLAALGNLLQPYGEAIHIACGVLSLVFVIALTAKIILFPQMIRDDLKNSIFASVSGTLFMTLMQLATYLAPVAYAPSFALWIAAIAGHFGLMAWFTMRFLRNFKLKEVFPTYFICFVGVGVASITAPAFGMESLGFGIFCFALACTAVLGVLITVRYFKHEVPEAARPLFCIYCAPVSLTLAGYLATCSQPNLIFVVVMSGIAQGLLLLVLVRLPQLMRLRFYPSFAAMTFPFVVSAAALGKTAAFLATRGMVLPVLDAVVLAETLLATCMVIFVVAHYVRFFAQRIEKPQSAAVVRENAQIARFAENFEN